MDTRSEDPLAKTLWVRGTHGKTRTPTVNAAPINSPRPGAKGTEAAAMDQYLQISQELLPPGPSWLVQIHPERSLCCSPRLPAEPTALRLIYQSDLTATPCPTPLQVSKSAAGFVCKERSGAGRPGNGFPTPNHCEQHKLQQNWIHLKKSIISSPRPLTERVYISKSISSVMNLY